MRDIAKFQTVTLIDENVEKIVVKHGFSYIYGNSKPYFSITCDIYKKARNGRWVDVGGGADHEAIIKAFPELAELVQFHLCDDAGTPIHYLANGMYWYEEGNSEYFKSTIVALPDETFELNNPNMQAILVERLPRLQKLFKETMEKFNVEMITQDEIDKLK